MTKIIAKCKLFNKNPKVAQAKLLRWIKKNPKFHQQLLGLGLSPFDNDYSPEQVRGPQGDRLRDREETETGVVERVSSKRVRDGSLGCKGCLVTE